MTKRAPKKTDSLKTDSRVVSKEEKDLWDQVTGNIEPLTIPEAFKDLATDGVSRGKLLRPSRPYVEMFPVTSQPELLHGVAPGLDRATQRKMRRGKIIIDARIDLHGMTQSEAKKALSAFLCDCCTCGSRSVLVITGKGLGGEGVLRAAVPRWLNESNNRKMIRAFTHAAPKDGGVGALYVMLKRLR